MRLCKIREMFAGQHLPTRYFFTPRQRPIEGSRKHPKWSALQQQPMALMALHLGYFREPKINHCREIFQ